MLVSDSAATATRPANQTGEFSVTAEYAAVSRRSVRSYLPTPVSDEQVEELLRLTGRAPSAFNVQPWRFIVVRDADLKEKLSAASYGQKQVVSAPVVLALYSDMEDVLENVEEIVNPAMPAEKFAETVAMLRGRFGGMTTEDRATWGNAQANIALGYLLLLSKTLGLDTSPMLGFQPDQVKALLDIPATATITALVALGHGAEEGFVSHRHETSRIATFR